MYGETIVHLVQFTFGNVNYVLFVPEETIYDDGDNMVTFK